MIETTSVAYTVLGVERVSGAGRLIGLAVVEVDVAGVVLTLQGVQIKRRGDGTCECAAPVWRHPRSGKWLPAVILPPELSSAIADEIISTDGVSNAPR